MTDKPDGNAASSPPTTIDQHVGHRIRLGRLEHKLSPTTVARALDVPTSSLIDWEEGRSRIPAQHLLALSSLLSRPLASFFEKLPATLSLAEGLERPESDASLLRKRTPVAKH